MENKLVRDHVMSNVLHGSEGQQEDITRTVLPDHISMLDYQHLIDKIEFEPGVYNGSFNDKGQKHGMGTYLFTDGERYEGQWHNGLMHGQGTYYENDSGKYVGQFKENERTG